MESEISKAVKLKGVENWGIWKFQVEVLMSVNDVITVVDDTFENPGPEIPTTTQADIVRINSWKKLDGAARRIIVLTVSENVLIHIINCKTAKEMWKKLHKVYENKNETSKHMVQKQWFALGKDSKDDMATHIAKIRDLAHRLIALGDQIPDSMIVTKVLMTLPTQYQHFVTAWKSASEDQRTLTNLTSRLTMEETRVNLQQENSVLAARRNCKPKRDSKDSNEKRIGKCFKCGKEGH